MLGWNQPNHVLNRCTLWLFPGPGTKLEKSPNFEFLLVILYWCVFKCRHGKNIIFCICYLFMFISLQPSDTLHLTVLECFLWNYLYFTVLARKVSYCLENTIFNRYWKIDYVQGHLTVINFFIYRDCLQNIIHFLNASCIYLWL